MHSIKKLFQLSTSVKMQFFKSFMLPYFNYCSTLAIYYTKTAIQRMCNCYNLCLFKLFGIKNSAQTNNELNDHNNKLEKYNLNAYEHRLMSNLATFAHKIINNDNAPLALKELFKPKPISNTDRESVLKNLLNYNILLKVSIVTLKGTLKHAKMSVKEC
jgi:hypothetical protein